MITGVYDYVPEGADRPYVTIGEAIETPDNVHGGFGRQTLITLHVWTSARGYIQGGQIADRIMALLDHQPLTIPGRKWISTRFEYAEAMPDPDPRIRHHVIRFRVTSTILQEV